LVGLLVVCRRHWLVTNIPGSQVNKGTVLAPYMGPGPPPGTGHHRYVFVVFKQKDQIPHETMNKCVALLFLNLVVGWLGA
jgi:phosphatidylethanolamine-binding protein (PEBP) family uncharacterized protein